MPELSPRTQQLIRRYRAWYHALEPKEGAVALHVDEVASAVARFYEKIRGVVDWREEHLLRKAAIERILRRRILMGEDTSQIAEPFVLELIRSGHFPNDTILESKLQDIQRAIDKYVSIIQNAPFRQQDPQKLQLQDWLLSIAACEIEEILSPPSKERALINYMTSHMEERIRLENGNISERTRKTQIAIACQQALFKVDPPLISYGLLTQWYPEWRNLMVNSTELMGISENIYELKAEIEQEFIHPLAPKFYTLCEQYDTSYLLLGDIIAEDPLGAAEKLKNPETLEDKVKEAYDKRLRASSTKIKRAAVYSTISIFITKVALALGVEIPVDRYFTGSFGLMTLGINIAVPPLLMAALVLTIRAPSKSNLQRTILEITKLVYGSKKKETYIIRVPRKRGTVMSGIVFLFYVLSFVVSFGVIIWALNKLNFSLLSQLIFLMFISLIAFAGAKLRQRSKELIIQEEKGFFLLSLLDIFALPIVQTGRWLSSKLARYNIFIILLNAFIEMPLQIFIEFIEQWRYFLMEKKEEIH